MDHHTEAKRLFAIYRSCVIRTLQFQKPNFNFYFAPALNAQDSDLIEISKSDRDILKMAHFINHLMSEHFIQVERIVKNESKEHLLNQKILIDRFIKFDELIFVEILCYMKTKFKDILTPLEFAEHCIEAMLRANANISGIAVFGVKIY